MSTHMPSKYSPTPLKLKSLQAIILIIVTYHIFILYYHIRHS